MATTHAQIPFMWCRPSASPCCQLVRKLWSCMYIMMIIVKIAVMVFPIYGGPFECVLYRHDWTLWDLYFTSENWLIKLWNLILSIKLTAPPHTISLTIIIITDCVFFAHIVTHCSQNWCVVMLVVPSCYWLKNIYRYVTMHNYENVFLQYYGTKNCAVINQQPALGPVGIQFVVLWNGIMYCVQPHLLHSYMHWNKSSLKQSSLKPLIY